MRWNNSLGQGQFERFITDDSDDMDNNGGKKARGKKRYYRL